MDNEIILQQIKSLLALLPSEDKSNEQTVFARPLIFSQKEIAKMPKTFRKEFRTNGASAHVRKRTDERYRCSYEIRYRRNGYNVSASARTLEEAKLYFIQKLKEIEDGKVTKSRYPSTFDAFAKYWFENYHKRKVKESTFSKTFVRLKNYLLPTFQDQRLADIHADEIQSLLDGINASGKGKTKDECHSILNQIFSLAKSLNLVKINPLAIVINTSHERVNGKALTINEQKRVITEASAEFQPYFALALFAGLRPNELESVRITDKLIYANNSKRKNGKTEIKRIPISPMLAPYIINFTPSQINLTKLRTALAKILPGHKLYDLRTTFYTYARMCNINANALNEMFGHSEGKLAKAYTDLPDDFLIEEGKKLSWW